MQLQLGALKDYLRQATAKRPAPLYAVHGDEHLLALEAIDVLRRAARAQGFTEREVTGVEHDFSWSCMTEAQQSMSLSGDYKTAELRIPSGKLGKNGGGALRALAVGTPSGPTTDTVTLITLPHLGFVTAKSAWFAALGGAGVSIKVDSMDRTRLPGWIGGRLARQQQCVEPDEPGRRALQFIADRVKGNLLTTHQEIQELGLLRPPDVLTFDDVRDVVLNVARYDVFKLSGVMLASDVPHLVRTLEGLRGEGEAMVLVLWTLTGEVRALSKIASGAAQGKPVASMLRELRVWGPRERLVSQVAQRLSRRELEGALSMAAKLDRQVKGLREPSLPAEPWNGLLQLATRIARPGSLPVPA